MKQKILEKEPTEQNLIFLKVVLIVSALFLANIIVYALNGGKGNEVTGLSVDELGESGFGASIIELYNSIPITTRIFLGIQWGLLLIILIFSYVKDKKVKVAKDEVEGIDMEKASENAKTDLDTLYNLLKEKKQLKIPTIAKLFNEKEEIVSGWCKTLETGNLVTIEYSTTGDALVRVLEEKEQQEKQKQEKESAENY